MNKKNWLKIASRLLALYGVMLLTALEDMSGAQFVVTLLEGVVSSLYLILCAAADSRGE